jgi:hypothetical protein
MCLEKEMNINHSKGMLTHNECLEEQIEPFESLKEKSLEKQLEKNLLKVELLWEEFLAKQKNPQVSQSKTFSSTLDALDVSGVKDKENIRPNILQGLGMMNVSLPSSQARIKINSSHADNGLVVDELPNLKET